MADFKSSHTIEKNAKIWAKNLPNTTRRFKRNLPTIENFKNYVRLPVKKDVLGFYYTLLENEKSKQKRVNIIHKELINLWKKMRFPILSEQAIIARITKLIGEYEKNQRYPKEEFKIKLDTLFDITKPQGQWLCEDDKKLYEKQIESEGKIGYTTSKTSPIFSIHPSKRKRYTQKDNKTVPQDVIEDDKLSTSTTNSDTSSNESIYESSQKSKKKSTSLATKLVTELTLSTRKESKVCLHLAKDGINLPTPSQSEIFKSMNGKEQQLKIKNILMEEKDYCLHFDEKRLPEGKRKVKHKEEYRDVCLHQSPTEEIKLGVVRCESGSAESIFKGIGKGSCSKDETQSQGENVPKVKVEVMDGLEDYADPGTSATPSTSSFDVSEQVTTPIPLDSYTNQEEDLGHVSEPSQPSVNGKRETEFDLFGKIIGVQLNNMPLNDALQLQFKIQQVITEFRLNNYRVASSSLHSTQRASARSHVSENASIEDLEIKTEYVSDSFLSD